MREERRRRCFPQQVRCKYEVRSLNVSHISNYLKQRMGTRRLEISSSQLGLAIVRHPVISLVSYADVK